MAPDVTAWRLRRLIDEDQFARRSAGRTPVAPRAEPGHCSSVAPNSNQNQNPLPKAALAALTERSDTRGLVRLALHVAVIAGAGAVYAAALETAWMLPAAWVYGTCLAFLFAPLHETVHYTAFRSRGLNRAVSVACGWILVLPPRFFRAFHLEHHRYTQDPERDPELADAPLRTWRQYVWRISGGQYWVRQLRVIARFAAGRVTEPCIPRAERERVVREARMFLASYAAVGALSAVTGTTLLLWFWIVPLLLGQPMLRLYLLAEHTGCPTSPDMLENSRTVHTNALVRFLAWNMPYHAEHHAYASIPFHALPRAHARLAPFIRNQPRGYARVHRDIVRGLA